MKQAVLEALAQIRADGGAAALITVLESGAQQLVHLADTQTAQVELDYGVPMALVRDAISTDRSAVHELEHGAVFVQVFNHPLRMFVVGAVHIAQALVPMANTAGFQVTLVDPRTAFASKERFPGIALSHDWPDEAFAKLRPDARTAIVTLSHDPKIDDPALHSALTSPAFYVGSLGSRRTHASRLERLRSQGFRDEALRRIHAPIGLDIGAQSTAEIAVAILAEVIHSLRRPVTH